MSLAMARLFVLGFGLELGSVISLCLWADTEHAVVPLVALGASMMGVALAASTK